jgi:rhomboid protease GluP
MKTHATSLAVFMIYGIGNGLAKTGIDNAAHIGGLIGGIIMGFALGRPLDPERAARKPGALPAAGAAFCVMAIVALAVLTPNSRGGYELEKRFLADLNWLAEEEKVLSANSRDLLTRAKAPGATEADVRPRINSLVGQWQGAHDRFAAYELEPASRLNSLHHEIIAYTDTRRRAMAAMARAFSEPQEGKAHVQEFNRLMKEGDAIVQRVSARSKQSK